MVYDTGATEYVMEVDVKFAYDEKTNKNIPIIYTGNLTGSSWQGLAINFGPKNFGLYYSGSTGDTASGHLQKDGANWRITYASIPGYDESTWFETYHVYRVEVADTGINVYVDGTFVLNYDRYLTELEFTRGATKCAIGANCTSGVGLNAVYYDNFKVWTKATEETVDGVLDKSFDIDFEGETVGAISAGVNTIGGQTINFGRSDHSIYYDAETDNTFLRYTSPATTNVAYYTFTEKTGSDYYVISFKTRLNTGDQDYAGQVWTGANLSQEKLNDGYGARMNVKTIADATVMYEYRDMNLGTTISGIGEDEWIEVECYRLGDMVYMIVNGVSYNATAIRSTTVSCGYVGMQNYHTVATAGYIADVDDISYRQLDENFQLETDDMSKLFTAGEYKTVGTDYTLTYADNKVDIAKNTFFNRVIHDGFGYTDFSLTFNIALLGDADSTGKTSDSTGLYVRAKAVNGKIYGYQLNVTSGKQIWLTRVDGVNSATKGTTLFTGNMGAYGKDVTVKGVGDRFIITYNNSNDVDTTVVIQDDTYSYGYTGLRAWASNAIGGISLTVKDYQTKSRFDSDFDALTEAKFVGDDGKVLRSAIVNDGDTFEGEIEGNYIGIERDGGIYSTYSVVVDGDTTVTALSASGLQLVDGAAARLSEDYSGLRFETNVSKELYEKLLAIDENVQYGGILLPTELIEDELTVDLDIAKVVPSSGPVLVEADGVYKYRTTLYDIPETEYDTAVSARSYITVTLSDGVVRTVYTDYDQTNNSRSIKQVAETILAMDDLTTKYNEREIELLQKFAGVVAE